MSTKAIVVGSGAGGSTAAMVLAQAGWDVLILEKGTNRFSELGTERPGTVFSNDELKSGIRNFEVPDPGTEPRVFRSSASETNPFVGSVEGLAQTVGGGTVHWDAKTPRYWDIDFAKLSLLGPVPGAAIIDWPFDYAEIEPYYEEVERLIGVAGDADQIPAVPTLAHAPRGGSLPLPAGPPQLSSLLAADGAKAMGLHPFPAPMAINSRRHEGRPACVNCGFCSGFGCPSLARLGALAPLSEALRLGAELRPEATAVDLPHRGRNVRGVTWIDADGHRHTEAADVVVLAAMAIETIRLALLAGLPDPNQVIGRFLMLHWFSQGVGIFLSQRLHTNRGRSTTHVIDDFADPDFPGARAAAKAAGLPYFRGGTVELGGSQTPISEAQSYQQLLPILRPHKPFGTEFKQLMRSSILRDRVCGAYMPGEDLPYPTNVVDLDPVVRDWRHIPAPRITKGPGPYEIAAQAFYQPLISELLTHAGADVVNVIPELPSARFPFASGSSPQGDHVMGGMRMGADPATSATDGDGRYHFLDNLFVADGSVFPSAGGHNPTLTIMATALRNSRRWI